jgi:hypothetical protein
MFSAPLKEKSALTEPPQVDSAFVLACGIHVSQESGVLQNWPDHGERRKFW